MCHYLDSDYTEKFKKDNANKILTFYKVLRKTTYLFAPHHLMVYKVGDNISDRESNELTLFEKNNKVINQGIHVFATFQQAENFKINSIGWTEAVVEVTVHIDNLVAINRIDAVFTKVTLSQSEYDRALYVNQT